MIEADVLLPISIQYYVDEKQGEKPKRTILEILEQIKSRVKNMIDESYYMVEKRKII